jgi:hypothetical protein
MSELERKKLEELLRAMQKEIYFMCKDILESVSRPIDSALEGTNPPG